MVKKKIIFSVCFSIAVIVMSYLIGNTSYPMAGEKAVLVRLNNWKSYLNINRDSVPDDVLLINVAYDKALTTYSEDGLPIGQFTITDRRKLLDFLTKAKAANNYKFIMMDVIFERGIVTEYDSALFHTIVQTPRLVIPVHTDAPLQDSILYSKAANADYNITQDETNFVRYQYIHDDVPSMPLKIYEGITGKTIKRHGLIYTSEGHLCSNGVTLKMPVKISGAYMDNDSISRRSYVYMGADILDVDSIIPVADQIDGKIIIIGDFNADVHRTYVGKQPGSVICLNAYYALLRGEHFVSYPFLLFLFVVYAVLTYLTLSGWSHESVIKNPWLQLVASFFTLTIVFTVIAMIVYATPSGIVYNPVFPTMVFALLPLVLNTIKRIKNIIL